MLHNTTTIVIKYFRAIIVTITMLLEQYNNINIIKQYNDNNDNIIKQYKDKNKCFMAMHVTITA